ncbi:MAG TPA: hypothetical protein VMM78_09625 [Thermomicrobiales bacterium]|nr:hypothetical protein [Thermomicrobiales bacterium]
MGHVEIPAHWQDEQCHRAAWAGPSQAAAILERVDPHTSVTFVSLACSGATINTLIYDPGYKGAGLLRHYAGIYPKADHPSLATFVPAQMEQAAYIAEGREIDALLVSGGGTFTGDLIAPSGQIEVSGSNVTVYGGLIGRTVKLSGSGWRIVA